MRTDDFSFDLPAEFIAQHPLPDRTASRLLALSRTTGHLEFSYFKHIGNYLRTGDTLVLNTSRVIPARLTARKVEGGGTVEVFLVRPASEGGWWTLARPQKRLRLGVALRFPGSNPEAQAVVCAKEADGLTRVEFSPGVDVPQLANQCGSIPLPPYIHRHQPEAEDRERYQTVYAQEPGSVAAPTAGLHFTEALLSELQTRGIGIAPVTLHVGLGTFLPVKVDDVADHVMHEETFTVPEATVRELEETRRRGGRVVAVGTTSLRVLESVARANGGRVVAGGGSTRLFIHPPATFQVVDAMITNFHLPRSTLLMLVSAFAAPGSEKGRELILRAYQRAIEERFRFFSFGDAMLIH